MSHAGRVTSAAAGLVWFGVAVGTWHGGTGWVAAATVALAVGWAQRRHPVVPLLCLALVGGCSSGWVAASATRAVWDAPLPTGRVEVVARAVTDPVAGTHQWRQVLVPEALAVGGAWTPWDGPPLILSRSDPLPAPVGARVVMRAGIVAEATWLRGVPVAGRLVSSQVSQVVPPSGAGWRAADVLRRRVATAIEGRGDGGALLAGFLIGETSGVASHHLDALERAGLTHFVAVSGSNVALFLGLWWLLLAPLARFPRLRAASGIAGVALFALVTRAEPSVLRASAMLVVVLIGRTAGWAFDRWTALATGVAGCLLVSGGLAFEVGFQLSVAATAGVMAGARLVRFRPRPVAAALGASLAAQLAVAPILLTVFGTVPVMSPVANLVAAPLVGFATVTGGLGSLVGSSSLVGLGAAAAGAVLEVAHVASGWPQAGPGEALLLAVPGVLAWRWRRLRNPIAAGTALAVVGVLLPLGPRVERPAVVFLDVGQGDSALVLDEGFVMLVDGGPDPATLARALHRYGVSRIDLLVASHVHADHLEGLRAVVGEFPVGRAWVAFEGHETPAGRWLSGALKEAGVPHLRPEVGSRHRGGSVEVTVLGPRRRYDSPNDQSIVLEVEVAGRTVLFPGDIEVVAQGDLPPRPVDVLKVPHQGAGTSDPAWLEGTRPGLAVVSVGDNDFGHPAPWVIETLEGVGSTVLRTDHGGDVVVAPGGVSRRP